MYIAFGITNKSNIGHCVWYFFSPVNDVIHVKSTVVFLDYITHMYAIGQSNEQLCTCTL